jgi:lipopolysaccharide export system protein LptA
MGVYSVGPRTVLMSGNVVLKRQKDVMRGARLTVNLATGQATLGAGPKGTPGAPQGRVQGVFSPTQDQSQAQSQSQPQPGAAR